MAIPLPSRRHFCTTAALACLAPHPLLAQVNNLNPGSTRVDVADIDRIRILAAADRYLNEKPQTITSIPAPHSPGTPHDFYSEATDWAPDPDAPTGPYLRHDGTINPDAFTAHSDALLRLSLHVPTLTAAYLVTKDPKYAAHAAAHLHAWFIDPAQSMTPALLYGQMIPRDPVTRFEGVLEAVQLVEVAQAASYIATSGALSEPDLATLYTWFSGYLDWLNTSRLGGLARDQKSHHGSSWLLQAASIARLLPPEPKGADHGLTTLRHHFKSITLRAQIVADGTFPRELASSYPFRYSLFNLDMLAGVCDLLSTRFESLWDYELQDGPGMRAAIARHYPYMLHRGTWPYTADASRFNQLPLRQPSLLLAGRAYARPEYIDLWKKLNPDPADPVLQRTFPIRQPLLWVRRTPAL
jgi:hypothetical protein